MSLDFALYSVYHKKFYIPIATYVVPIQAGKALSSNQLQLLGDDTGDNISSRNPHFCELTALYWIWRNGLHLPTDIWGLCHYRRYFCLRKKSIFGRNKNLISLPITEKEIDKVLIPALAAEIKSMLSTFDVIIQKPMYVYRKKGKTLTIEQHYKQDHIANDWDTMKAVVLELYPDYKESLEKFCQSETMSFANMMIAKAEIWDKYLTWLFTIMFELEKRITISHDSYQARVFGFLSERIMNLYIQHERIKVGYLPIAVFDKT